MNTLTPELIGKFRSFTAQDSCVKPLNASMAKTELKDLAFVPMNAAKLDGPFEIEIKTHGITAQKISGRCWMFAFMNVLRERVIGNCGLKDFELSGNYLAFYDKLEKANNALECAIANANQPLSDRMLEYILNGFGDGGEWSMGVDLVKKYGIVPKSVMPESYQSTHTASFMRIFQSLVRKDICELRAMIANGEDPTSRKEEMMAEIYKMECIVFGEPIDCFDFEYKDSDGNYVCDRGLTPKTFYDKYINLDFDQYVTVTNFPLPHVPENKPFTYHYSGNMIESNIWKLNLEQEAFEELCLKQLKDKELVWFGCDSQAFGARVEGVWDPDCFAYDGLLGNINYYMDKTQRILHHDSVTTHAMVFCGVNFDNEGNPNRWKIENSWGDEVGKKGYFVCSEKYFKEFVNEAIINKKYLSEEQLKMLEKEATVLMPWEASFL